MSAYNILNYVGAAALFLYNFLRIEERSIVTQSRFRNEPQSYAKKRFWIIVETIIISLFQYAPILVFNKTVGAIFGTGVNYFGLLYLSPVFLGIGCWVLGTDWMNQIDLVTPAFPLALFFSKLACFSAGCCAGIACEFGIPNAYTGIKEFPIQLLEAFVAILIFAFFMKYRKKLKSGTAFPIYVMLYSAIRFFTEFLRVEDAVFMGLKTYQILCLIGIVVGAMEYYLAVTDKRNIEKDVCD